MKYSLSNLSVFKKKIYKKTNNYFVIVALIIITIISIGFGVVFSRGEDISDRKIEGFGEFISNGEYDRDMNITYSFNYSNGNSIDKPEHENVSARKILSDTNNERPYYQIRFPKNAYSFKPLEFEFTCVISSIEPTSKSGTISCEIWEHDVYDEENNFEYKKRNEKGTRMTNKVELRHKLVEKRIFSSEYYPQDGKDNSGTIKNTTLKNNTYKVIIDSGLPKEIIPNKHTIWIGGNSSILYESITMELIGNVEEVQQIYELTSDELKKLSGDRLSKEDKGKEENFDIVKPSSIPSSIYIDKIIYKNYINSWGDDDGRCLSVRHKIIFEIFGVKYYKLGGYEKYITHEIKSQRFDGACHDIKLEDTKNISVGKYVESFEKLKINVTFNSYGGNNHLHHFTSKMMEIYYRIKRKSI